MWVMSILKVQNPTEFHVYIGALKIAEIAFTKAAKWKCYMRLPEHRIKDYETMSDALKDLHKILNSPSPEGATVGHKGEPSNGTKLGTERSA